MDTLSEIRQVADDLRKVDRIAQQAAEALGPVVRDLKNARLRARARVLDEDPKMRLPDVDMRVELDENVQALADREIELSWQLKAAKETAHSLRQILHALDGARRTEQFITR